MKIKALLIDADGVIQHATRPWTPTFRTLFGFQDQETANAFTEDIFAAETRCLKTESGFRTELIPTLRKWRLDHKIDQVIDVMCTITPHAENHRLFSSIRKTGILCCIASNQVAERAQHMSETLGYSDLFDHEFYSCRLGAAKPDQNFYTAALKIIGQELGSTLFIDDRVENIASAHSIGMNAELYDLADGSDALRRLLQSYGIIAR